MGPGVVVPASVVSAGVDLGTTLAEQCLVQPWLAVPAASSDPATLEFCTTPVLA